MTTTCWRCSGNSSGKCDSYTDCDKNYSIFSEEECIKICKQKYQSRKRFKIIVAIILLIIIATLFIAFMKSKKLFVILIVILISFFLLVRYLIISMFG